MASSTNPENGTVSYTYDGNRIWAGLRGPTLLHQQLSFFVVCPADFVVRPASLGHRVSRNLIIHLFAIA
jgi:hypothetical protein